MKVPLLDLKPQYQSIKNEIMLSLDEVITSQSFILGPNVEKLELEIASYCGAEYAVGVNSGSDALLLSMMALNIKSGDKIITTPYTFFATVGSICRLNAEPLFADIDPVTYNIDPVKLESLIDSLSKQEKTKLKAIIPVHLYGQCADMEPILEIAKRYNIAVIEDAAQALGASCSIKNEEKKSCAMGDFGCLSFFPSKNLGCFGDGGMITVNNEEIATKLKSLRMHGMGETYFHQYVGMNGRLDALQAVVLLIKLPYLDSWAEKRTENAGLYKKLFKEQGLLEYLSPPQTGEGFKHVFNQFVIRTKDRDKLKEHLIRKEIGCAIYYPLSLHLQECFKFLGYKEGDFPESEKASNETLALPVFPELEKAQIEYVAEQIGIFYGR